MSRIAAVVAAHLLVVRGDSVLLLRRANTGYEDGRYSVPAGHVEPGEHPVATGARELAEEAGIAVGERDLRFALVMHRLSAAPRVDFFFEVQRWEGEPRNCEPDKCDDLRWFRFDELPLEMVPYVRLGIESYRAGRSFVEMTESHDAAPDRLF